MLNVDEDYRRQGFGEALQAQMLEFFIANGVDRVEVMASMEDGGAHWAQNGVDFDGRPDRLGRSVAGLLPNALAAVRDSVTNPVSERGEAGDLRDCGQNALGHRRIRQSRSTCRFSDAARDQTARNIGRTRFGRSDYAWLNVVRSPQPPVTTWQNGLDQVGRTRLVTPAATGIPGAAIRRAPPEGIEESSLLRQSLFSLV